MSDIPLSVTTESNISPDLPILFNPPKGVEIQKPLVIGETSTSNIYLGKNANNEAIVFDIAQSKDKIPMIQAKYNFLDQRIHFLGKLTGQPEKVEDIKFTAKVGDYKIGGQYADYTITTRFVQLDRKSMSSTMYNNGQITEEYVDGKNITNDNGNLNENIPPEVHAAVFMSYIDFCILIKKEAKAVLDTIYETDQKIIIDDDQKTITSIRIDPSPYHGDNYLLRKNEQSAIHVLADSLYALYSGNEIDFASRPTRNRDFTKDLPDGMKALSDYLYVLKPEEVTFEKVKEIISTAPNEMTRKNMGEYINRKQSRY